jgi:hypothetical protein
MSAPALYITCMDFTSSTPLPLESVFATLHMARSPLPHLMMVVARVRNVLLAELANHH